MSIITLLNFVMEILVINLCFCGNDIQPVYIFKDELSLRSSRLARVADKEAS